MRGNQDGDAFGVELPEMFAESDACKRIEPRGGLVEEQNLRLVEESLCQNQALFPAEREMFDEVATALRETRALESAVNGSMA